MGDLQEVLNLLSIQRLNLGLGMISPAIVASQPKRGVRRHVPILHGVRQDAAHRATDVLNGLRA